MDGLATFCVVPNEGHAFTAVSKCGGYRRPAVTYQKNGSGGNTPTRLSEKADGIADVVAILSFALSERHARDAEARSTSYRRPAEIHQNERCSTGCTTSPLPVFDAADVIADVCTGRNCRRPAQVFECRLSGQFDSVEVLESVDSRLHKALKCMTIHQLKKAKEYARHLAADYVVDTSCHAIGQGSLLVMSTILEHAAEATLVLRFAGLFEPGDIEALLEKQALLLDSEDLLARLPKWKDTAATAVRFFTDHHLVGGLLGGVFC